MAEHRKVYLDNAATTPMATEVIEVMTHAMHELFGNPSSIHSSGRQVRSELEKARKKIANLFGCTPSEIFFTSGGTEADNMAIQCAVKDLGITQVISSALEHHAVLHTLEHLSAIGSITLHQVNADSCGRIDLNHLEQLLIEIGKDKPAKTLVSLMHANNETGTLLDLSLAGDICRKYQAIFHSDTVQTVGHYHLNLSSIPVDFITCAAHKIHGPKGVGFIFIRNTIKVKPFIHGGSQERNMRGGTENVYGIMGMAKAIELSLEHLDEHKLYILALKDQMISLLSKQIPGIEINGCSLANESLYTVLNISLPESDLGDMLLFNLDINGVAASGGSACSSGSSLGSHVLSALEISPGRPSVRFSFSRFTTEDDVIYAVDKLAGIVAQSIKSVATEQAG